MNPISPAADAERAELATLEEARRKWVASLKPGDEVEVPYSLDRADIYRMEVIKNDGGWLTLLPLGKRNRSENWVKACAVNGWTVPYGTQLVPPGTTKPLDLPGGPDEKQFAAIQRYANAHGRYWKRELSTAWATGADEREADACLLRAVRNEYGPEWLYSKCNRIRPQAVRK